MNRHDILALLLYTSLAAFLLALNLSPRSKALKPMTGTTMAPL